MKLTARSNMSKLIIGENMASFRLALSKVVLLYIVCGGDGGRANQNICKLILVNSLSLRNWILTEMLA